MQRLKGRVAIVTGAAQGIGEAILRTFIAEGATVIALDVKKKELEELCTSLGTSAIPTVIDLRDQENIKSVVDSIITKHTKIDILVNNAGICLPGPYLEIPEKMWKMHYEVNVEAPMALCKAVIPNMAKHTYGRIVNIASVHSIVSIEHFSHYASTKGALVAFSHALAAEVAPNNILVNCVSPGFVRTPATASSLVKAEFKETYVDKRKIPLARPAEPSEIAKAVLFLSGDECTYITGANLVVDGGLTITF